jgi:hypothetical protein
MQTSTLSGDDREASAHEQGAYPESKRPVGLAVARAGREKAGSSRRFILDPKAPD